MKKIELEFHPTSTPPSRTTPLRPIWFIVGNTILEGNYSSLTKKWYGGDCFWETSDVAAWAYKPKAEECIEGE